MKPKQHKLVAVPDFHADYLKLAPTPEGKGAIMTFMEDICMLLDQGIQEGDTWLTLGVTKNRTSVLLTLHQGEDIQYIVGATLQEFLSNANSL